MSNLKCLCRKHLLPLLTGQQDHERKRVLDGLPLGKPQVAEKVGGYRRTGCAP